MPTPIITAAAPGNVGLTITTIEDLEREAESKSRALHAASAVLNRPAQRTRLRFWLRWPVLIVELLTGRKDREELPCLCKDCP